VWAKRGADAYLIYQVWARLSFTDAHRKLVEDKANGTAVISSLKHEIAGTIPG